MRAWLQHGKGCQHLFFKPIVVVMKHHILSQFLQIKKIMKAFSIHDILKTWPFLLFFPRYFIFQKKYTEIYSHSNFINISYSIINWIIFYLLIILLKKYIFLCLHLSLSLVHINFIRMEKRRRKKIHEITMNEWKKILLSSLILINVQKMTV